MAKQTLITKSAKGEYCTLILGNCSDDETVVLCHIGKNRGMGIKCSDHFAIVITAALIILSILMWWIL